LIYVANPYSSHSEQTMQERYDIVEKYTAFMMKEGYDVISPIVHGHHLAINHNMPTSFEFWQKWCLALLDVCDEIHVLMIDGWKESTGLMAEIEYAEQNNLVVTYLSDAIVRDI
jgi:hypothetical protein